jgi:RNA polymerase sigma-70 factor (ECF subfamily)
MNTGQRLEILVLRCQLGDRDAFEELFGLYQPRLRYYVRRLAPKANNIDDMLQDIWLSVYRKIEKLKEVKAFPVWLYRIARNRVFSDFRMKQAFASLPEEPSLPGIQDGPEVKAECAEAIHEALQALPPHHREALTLFFLEQMSYKSIAEVTRCHLGTVRSRLYHAKRSLREKLESQNGKE